MYRHPRETRNQRRNREDFEREMLAVERALGGFNTVAHPLFDDYQGRFLDNVFETAKSRAGAAALTALTFDTAAFYVIEVTSADDAYAEYYAEEVQQRTKAAFSKHVLKGVNIDQTAIERTLSGTGVADYDWKKAVDTMSAMVNNPAKPAQFYMSKQEWDDISKDATYVTSFDEAPPPES